MVKCRPHRHFEIFLCLAAGAVTTLGQQIDPAVYARLLDNNAPMFQEVTSRLKTVKPANVLDLGTGPGEPSVTIAKALPSTKVTATDVQEGMIAKAKGRGLGLDNIIFYVTSADDLSHFGDSSFEAVTMIYALMFVPDREKCLREIARVLRPGGRAYIAVWKNLKFFQLGVESVATLMKRTPPTPKINPMALSSPGAVESLVGATEKLRVLDSSEVPTDFSMGSPKDTCDAAMITAGSNIQILIEEGMADAKDQFCKIFLEKLDAEGSLTPTGYVVNDNIAQLLTVVKAKEGEEL